jgi:hypothetical protein
MAKNKILHHAIDNNITDPEKLGAIADNINMESHQIPDMSKSGLYYIKGMHFRYRGQRVDDTINQYLVLTKVSTNLQYYNNSDLLLELYNVKTDK